MQWVVRDLSVAKARELVWLWAPARESRYFKRAADALFLAIVIIYHDHADPLLIVSLVLFSAARRGGGEGGGLLRRQGLLRSPRGPSAPPRGPRGPGSGAPEAESEEEPLEV